MNEIKTTEIKDSICNGKGNYSLNAKKKFYVCIEGQEYPWTDSTITTEEIASLGGWDVSIGVIEIDKDNNERTLQQGEVVELKPGHGFAKKVCWKRGLNVAEERIQSEVKLLRNKYPDLVFISDDQWLMIPKYVFGSGWSLLSGNVAFQIPTNGFPGTPPYGIYVHTGLRFNGNQPNNYSDPSPNQPPFDGVWAILSWAPQDGFWRPGATVRSGTNLINWVDGFASRFREGQ